MYENILLLLDCSPVDEAIVNHVVALARIHKSTVHLFHVVHAHTLDQERALVAAARDRIRLRPGGFGNARAPGSQRRTAGKRVPDVEAREQQATSPRAGKEAGSIGG